MAKNDPTRGDAPQDDPTFDTTTADSTTDHATDTTQLEQTVHTDQTQQLETTGSTDQTEQLDTTTATRAIEVDEPATSRDLFGDPVVGGAGFGDEGTQPGTAAYRSEQEPAPALPERPSGPHAPAIVLGLVVLTVAGIILGQELGDLTVDWGDIGPVGIVVTGAVLVLFGLVGLLTSRRSTKSG